MKTIVTTILFFIYTGNIFGQYNIPNGSFESWTSSEPDSWSHNGCPSCVPQFETYVAQQDSLEVYDGKYSLKLIYNYVYKSNVETKFSVTSKPYGLDCFVKTELFGEDTVVIEIKVFNNQTVVDSGYWLSSNTIDDWSEISIPLTTSNWFVDSMSIFIQGGNKSDGIISSSKFWVDKLSLDYVSSTKELVMESDELSISRINNGIIIYNNSALFYNFNVYNINGQLVFVDYNNNQSTELNTSDFRSGIYILELINDKEIFRKKVVIEN